MALSGIIKEVNFQVGDTVEVSQKVKEGDKTRTQIFRGLVISIKGHGEDKSFMVRRIAAGGIGVERIWPLNSPWLSKIKVVKKGKTKRAKLYYLRKRLGKGATRVKSLEGTENEKEKLGKTGRKSSSKISPK